MCGHQAEQLNDPPYNIFNATWRRPVKLVETSSFFNEINLEKSQKQSQKNFQEKTLNSEKMFEQFRS